MTLRFLTLCHHVFRPVPNTGNRRQPRFKEHCDTELENLSSLIRLSVSDSQKTDSSKDVSFTGI